MQIQAAMLIVLTHQLSELFMAVFCPNKNKSFRFIVAEAKREINSNTYCSRNGTICPRYLLY